MRMRRKLLVSLLLAFLLSTIGFAVYLATRPPPQGGVTIENFRRVSKGMKLGEVERILGTGEDQFEVEDLPQTCTWKSKGIIIRVVFAKGEARSGAILTREGQVFDMHTEGSLETVRRWVKECTGW
jgi:hypothetical protein